MRRRHDERPRDCGCTPQCSCKIVHEWSFTVKDSHDHGNWRYINAESKKGYSEKLQLHLSDEQFGQMRTVGTRLRVTVEVLP